MTAYATQQDLVDRFGNDAFLAAADRDRDGVADAAAVQGALDDASAMMDAAFSKRYDLPLPTTPRWAARICADLAMGLLVPSESATDLVLARFKAADKFMQSIASGDIGLGLPPAAVPQTGEVGDVKGEILGDGPLRQFRRSC